MAVIFYSIVPFAKMGANFGFVMRKIASVQSALPALMLRSERIQ